MIPIDVLSLTANIIQVVDLGLRVSKQLKEQYYSADGMLKENRESLQILHNLRNVQKACKLKLSSKADLTGEEEDLLGISTLCDDVARNLESELQSLEIPANTKYRRSQVLKQRIRAMLNKGKIVEIEERLRKVQQGLDTRLAFMVRDDTSCLTTKLDEVARMSESLQANTSAQLLLTKTQLVKAIDTQKVDYARIAGLLERIMTEGKEADKSLEILRRLRHIEYYKRYNDVKEAHQQTFQWIFDNQELGFSHWLEQQSSIYWITGKPGSGKSTLMKFIEGHSQTNEKLRSWAGGEDPIIAGHYFWISGAEIQRSLEGFLRSIVFQILRKHPILIPKVLPQQWSVREERELSGFSTRTLESILRTIAQESDGPRICLFIDGLDEFEGDRNEIMTILKELDASPSIKLCISSRPWEIFEHAFRDKPRCRVHELTKDDIRKYAQENIAKSPELVALMENEQIADEITTQIVNKAEGVFLWVFLVVRMLLDGPAEGANPQDLRRKIDSYPSELDGLFDRIYKSIKPEFRRETARILKVCLEAGFPPPLPVFDMMDKLAEDPDYLFNGEFHPVSLSEVNKLKDNLGRRINARCKDFVQVIHSSGKIIDGGEVLLYQVSFMHRTVRDYLEENLMPEHLNRFLSDEFDPYLVLVQGYFATLKQMDYSSFESQENLEQITDHYIQPPFDLAIQYSVIYEERWKIPLERMIDEMDQFLSTVLPDKVQPWISFAYKQYEGLNGVIFKDVVVDKIDIAVFHGLNHYVVKKLEDVNSQDKILWRRLLLALLVMTHGSVAMKWGVVIDKFFRLGADINQEVPRDGRTIWQMFLNNLNWREINPRLVPQGFDEQSMCEMIIKLLNNGADPNALVSPQRGYNEFLVEDFEGTAPPPHPKAIEEVLRQVLPVEIDNVLQVLEQKRAERAQTKNLHDQSHNRIRLLC